MNVRCGFEWKNIQMIVQIKHENIKYLSIRTNIMNLCIINIHTDTLFDGNRCAHVDFKDSIDTNFVENLEILYQIKLFNLVFLDQFKYFQFNVK